MKKYNSIIIALIVLGVLANSCGTALSGSSEQFIEEEWNQTYIVGDIYTVQSIQKTSDGGYVTARGFQLVKFGGVKNAPLQSGILKETPILTPTIRAGSNETKTLNPPEKASGFEAALVITTFLLVITVRRNRRK